MKKGDGKMIIRRGVVFLMAGGCFLAAGSAPESSAGKSPQEIRPNELRLYLQPDFSGPFKSWQLEPGMRQLFVPEAGDPWEGHIASLQLGSDVGAMLFQNKDFKFIASGYINFTTSIPDFKKLPPEAANNYSSLIIYSFPSQNPLGILAGNSSLNAYRFFPLPEQASERIIGIQDIRNLTDPVDFILFFHGGKNDEEITLTLCSDTLFRGETLQLPDASGAKNYQLSNFNFARKTKSLKMQVGSVRLNIRLKKR